MSDFEKISSALDIAGWFLAGLWFLRGWWLRRDDYPKIGMESSIRSLHAIDDAHLVEVAVTVKNGGEVRHKFSEIVFSLVGYKVSTVSREMVTEQVKIVDGKRMFPADWEYSFVDAGQSSTYKKMVRVPPGIKILRMEAVMSYFDEESDFHSAICYEVL